MFFYNVTMISLHHDTESSYPGLGLNAEMKLCEFRG